MIKRRTTAKDAPPSWAPRLSRCVAIPAATLLACVAMVGATAGPAAAADSGTVWGQVARIGGFDSCWFDNGNYDGQGFANGVSGCTANESYPGEDAESQGKFVDPSGFAVDAQDSNALYVLDRTSAATAAAGGAPSSWRIQKLDDQGDLLGSTTFDLTLPSSNSTDNLQMTGLAVDHNTGDLYALVDDYNGTVDVPYEIVAWSTTPDTTTKQLVAPSGLSQDTTLFTATGASTGGPGIVSTQAQLQSGPLNTAIYNPQGIAVDDQDGQDDLAIEASGTANNFGEGYDGQAGAGPTIVQLVATSGSSVGTLGEYWSSASGLNNTNGLITDDSLSASAPNPDPNASSTETELGPAGISANPSGGLTVLLDDAGSNGGDFVSPTSVNGAASNVDVVNLSADLSSEKILASQVNAAADTWGDDDPDGAAIATDSADPPYAVNDTSAAAAAGPQIVALSSGLYAADFGNAFPTGSSQAPTDGQAPLVGGSYVPEYWFPAYTEPGNEGIRLLNPANDGGTLSNVTPPLTSVYDTLGNPAAGGPCQIADGASSLAAGASGTVFDLTRGALDSQFGTSLSEGTGGREIIEFGQVPAGSTEACPSPQEQEDNTFEFADQTTGGGEQSADTALEVHVGDTVEFDGASIDYPTNPFSALSATVATAVPFAFEWDPGDGSQPIVDTMSVNPSKWPSFTQTYTYTKAGPHTVTLTLLGDYGTYTAQGIVDVDAAGTGTPQLAQSSASGTINQAVSFDASGSTPATGADIATYNWNWGDGTPVQHTTTPNVTHTFSAAKTYTVTLTVTDNDQQVSAPIIETVKITAGAPTASASASPASVTTGQSVSFTASATAGSGSSISSYGWDFGDGATGSGQTATHIYAAAGTYTVKLTVTDADGQTATSTTSVTVTNPPSSPKPSPKLKLSPTNVVLKAGVRSTTLTLQFKSVKVGARLTVKLSEPKVKKAKAKSARIGSNHVLKFATGKLPVGATKIRFYETVGKGKHAKLKLVKTETVHVKAKK